MCDQIFTSNGNVTVCEQLHKAGGNMSLAEWVAKGHDEGSSAHKWPADLDEMLVARAKQLLDLPIANRVDGPPDSKSSGS